MKQKGFTLVELLGVISVLAVLALLIIPTVNKSVGDSKNELYDAQIENIKDAARTWSADHVRNLPSTDEGSTIVTLADLKSGGYISKDIMNPKTKKKFSDTVTVTITQKNGGYIYSVNVP